ncbi:hypothetical protein PGR6_27030 [Pseudomonas sp. GR 6-02]|nr:hypothetical protein PGR6_27030 [Pseudomonas sp. GR 6-02]
MWQVLLLDSHGAAPYGRQEKQQCSRSVAYYCQCTGRAWHCKSRLIGRAGLFARVVAVVCRATC